VVDTLASRGARVGLVWIGLLLLAAVFAPFIASSYPLLVKESGRWSSPLLHQLGPADIAWLAAFIAAAALGIFRPVRFGTAAATVLWVVALVVPLTMWPAVRDGWLPGAESLGRRFGWSVIGVAGVIDAAVLAGVPLISSASRRFKLIMGVIAVFVAILLIVFPVRPPDVNVYETYRQKQAAGLIEKILSAPIPYSPNDYQRDVPNARLQPPSWQHLMGTEQSGADVFSRMLHASRIAFSVGFIATGISVVIGVIIGGLMGYFAGTVDILGMRLIEIFEAVPTLILLLTVSAFFGRNLYLMMTIIGLLSWTGHARFIRAEFLRLRNLDFVQAAIAAGLPLRSIIFRHMLPNGITAVLVNTSFGVASAILIESTLSFLGLGLVDEPSWGQLLNQARAGGTGFQWWIATFPGLAIFLTVFAYNLIGEAVRDAIDPKLRKRD
jgi:peptide/nickel transport system permease protein